MKRILIAVVTVVLGLGLLTACGDDDGKGQASSGDYCADLKAAKKEVDALKGGDFSTLEKTTAKMHELADEAPDEIEDEWATLVTSVDKLVALLKDAGLTDEDMTNLQSGQIPDGVDMEGLQKLMDELKALATEEFQQASDTITKHAKDECGVDLQA